ncbi:ester cyclase [Kocuria nitroreducens]|uniref:ester cyclase n=1 Tax=Kocuria nitroreducens TaxID=3058914 RepID=UPI0036DAFB32
MAEERVAAFNDHDAARFADFYADDARLEAPTFPVALAGREAIHQNEVGLLTAVPDAHVDMIGVITDGDTTALEVVLRGTHTGPLATPDGTVPPSGNTLDIAMVLVSTFGDDGRIVLERRYFDSGAMFRQFGLA